MLFLLCNRKYESVLFFPLQSRRVKDEEEDVSPLFLSPTPALKPAFSFSFEQESDCVITVWFVGISCELWAHLEMFFFFYLTTHF